eukprot:scaffold405463_cov51-Prasinocladus_malaysianus.AAC.1
MGTVHSSSSCHAFLTFIDSALHSECLSIISASVVLHGSQVEAATRDHEWQSSTGEMLNSDLQQQL